jgi:NTE family protein
MTARARRRTKRIGLALQGGGAIGAFTWGVLDALLADRRLAFDAISGTSAGALNAVVMADGLRRGGPDAARAQLRRLWQGISLQSAAIAAVDESVDALLRLWRHPGASPYEALLKLSPIFSPYNFNPLNLNPLLGLLRELVDFDRLRDGAGPRLHVSATNVETGENRVFEGGEITAETLMASASLPFLFQAMTIDGEAYWDGGYSGNPALLPLVEAGGIDDVLVVQLDPLTSRAVPQAPREILGRIRELTYNISLVHELGAIGLIEALAGRHGGAEAGGVVPRLHRIEAGQSLLDDQSRRGLDISWRFLEELHAAGRLAAENWLAGHFAALGRKRPAASPPPAAAVSRPPRTPAPGTMPISLALQGGGGHGAFTWGVLDRLLEAGHHDIRAISGASGGATNAAVLADGLAAGGAERAREGLERFWRRLATDMASLAGGDLFLRALYRQWQRWGSMQNGLISAGQSVTTLHQQSLIGILEDCIDFDRLRRASPTELFLAATNVRNGQSRIFTTPEIDAGVVAASACLPFIFPAVVIDGEAYWEGGYSDNPPLRPLLRDNLPRDVLLVHVYPAERRTVPKTPEQILERISEITFNNSALKELRAIGHVGNLIASGRLGTASRERHRIHRLHPPPPSLDREARRSSDFWPFFVALRDAGRAAASAYLAGQAEDGGSGPKAGRRTARDSGRSAAGAGEAAAVSGSWRRGRESRPRAPKA